MVSRKLGLVFTELGMGTNSLKKGLVINEPNEPWQSYLIY